MDYTDTLNALYAAEGRTNPMTVGAVVAFKQKETPVDPYQAIFNEALEAADKAFIECKPTPVVFGTAVGLFGREMVPGTERLETEGLCGFAWVEVRPTRSPFASWLRKTTAPTGRGTCGRHDDYRHCVSVSSNVSTVALPSQSYDRKCAWAYAFAKVLQSHGIRAVSADRLD